MFKQSIEKFYKKENLQIKPLNKEKTFKVHFQAFPAL